MEIPYGYTLHGWGCRLRAEGGTYIHLVAYLSVLLRVLMSYHKCSPPDLAPEGGNTIRSARPMEHFLYKGSRSGRSSRL